MNDNDIKKSLSNFESVWDRVSGRKPPVEPKKEEGYGLPELILLFQRVISISRRLLRTGRIRKRQCLAEIAAKDERQLRRLEAEYFLQTGEIIETPAERRVRMSAIESVREIYLIKKESASIIKKLLMTEQDKGLQDLLESILSGLEDDFTALGRIISCELR